MFLQAHNGDYQQIYSGLETPGVHITLSDCWRFQQLLFQSSKTMCLCDKFKLSHLYLLVKLSLESRKQESPTLLYTIETFSFSKICCGDMDAPSNKRTEIGTPTIRTWCNLDDELVVAAYLVQFLDSNLHSSSSLIIFHSDLDIHFYYCRPVISYDLHNINHHKEWEQTIFACILYFNFLFKFLQYYKWLQIAVQGFVQLSAQFMSWSYNNHHSNSK